MRKETEAVAAAFHEGRTYRGARSRSNGSEVILHDSVIAYRAKDGHIVVQLAGWDTTTTRDRINGVLSSLPNAVRVHRVKGQTVISNGSGAIYTLHKNDRAAIDPATGHIHNVW